jgi:hypothetical protein
MTAAVKILNPAWFLLILGGRAEILSIFFVKQQ